MVERRARAQMPAPRLERRILVKCLELRWVANTHSAATLGKTPQHHHVFQQIIPVILQMNSGIVGTAFFCRILSCISILIVLHFIDLSEE